LERPSEKRKIGGKRRLKEARKKFGIEEETSHSLFIALRKKAWRRLSMSELKKKK